MNVYCKEWIIPIKNAAIMIITLIHCFMVADRGTEALSSPCLHYYITASVREIVYTSISHQHTKDILLCANPGIVLGGGVCHHPIARVKSPPF